MSAPINRDDEENQIEEAIRNSLISASIERRREEAEKAASKCAEESSCGGESALTPTLREEAYSTHIQENNWYEINELRELDYFKTRESSKVFGEETLASQEFKALIPHFLSRTVPGDGFCLIRSVEALINERYKYIKNSSSRLDQTKTLKDIIDSGELKPDEILRRLGQESNYAEQLNLDGTFESSSEKGDFSSLDFNWVYIMAAKEDVRIVVFINSSTNKYMKHKIVYPVNDDDTSFKTYKSIDKTLFILNNGGHYYPLKLKEGSKNNTNLIKDLVKIWSNKYGNAIETHTEIILPGGESENESPTDPAEAAGAAMRILKEGKRKREEAEAAKKKKAEEAEAAKKKKAEDAKAEKEAKAAKAAADKAGKAARKAETAAEEAEKKLKEVDKELVVSFLTDLKHFVPEKKNDDEANSSFKVSDKRVVIYKKTFEETEKQDYNDLKDNIDENLKEEHKYVFKKGFIDNIREYYVIDDNYGKKESEVKPGQLLYRNVFGLDDGLKYRDSNGEEKEFIKYEKLKNPEDSKILNHIIKLDMKNRFKVNNNNEKYYNLRKKYLRSEHFLKLEQFKESEKFDDQVAFKMEKVTYMLKQNIFYKDNIFKIVPFSFSPDKHSLDDINENINKDKIEKENEKKDRRKKKEKYEDIELTGKKYGSGIMGATSMTIGSLMLGGVIAGGSAIAIGTLTGGIPFAIGAGVYAVKKTKEHRKKTESNYPYNLSTRFKRQLHRIVHIISFAMELKKKYTKEEHLIEEWKNTMINIQLRRIYNKFGFDNKLNNEAEKMLKNEFKAKMKIVKENKKSWFHKKNKA